MRPPLLRPRATLRPAGFHGAGLRSSYFEGWYVKLVDAARDHRWAVIPGVFLGMDRDAAGGPDGAAGGGPSEAFVQVLDGRTGRSWYHRYPLADFRAAEDRFDVRVGPNRFTEEQVDLDLPDGVLAGTLRSGAFDPWPVTWARPGIMGPYSWMPMECYHGVCSFGHPLSGTLSVEGDPVSFDGGRGYVEKDWGEAFPAGYVWMHSNSFDASPDTCLVASSALIPWRGRHFQGWIAGVRHRGRLYRWATYTGARSLGLEVDDTHVRWTLAGADGLLRLTAERGRGGLLHAPVRTQMHQRVEETLDAAVHVRLVDRHRRVVLDDTGRCAGLEVHGDVDRLLATAGK